MGGKKYKTEEPTHSKCVKNIGGVTFMPEQVAPLLTTKKEPL